MADIITPEQLGQIVPILAKDQLHLAHLAGVLSNPAAKYGLIPGNVFNYCLANMLEETDGLRIKEENLYYITPERLMQIWPEHFYSVDFAKGFVKQPEKLANFIYGTGAIAKQLENKLTTDGWDFRGSGFLQLTGRYSATAYAKYVSEDVEEIMQMLRNDDYWATDAAYWEYAIDKNCIPVAKAGDFKQVCRRINGGLIGYEERLTWLQKVEAAMN